MIFRPRILYLPIANSLTVAGIIEFSVLEVVDSSTVLSMEDTLNK